VKYVDAGYIIALSVLFLYAVSLLLRGRRLEKVAARLDEDARLDDARPVPLPVDGAAPDPLRSLPEDEAMSGPVEASPHGAPM
jgi:hypothetical protein